MCLSECVDVYMQIVSEGWCCVRRAEQFFITDVQCVFLCPCVSVCLCVCVSVCLRAKHARTCMCVRVCMYLFSMSVSGGACAEQQKCFGFITAPSIVSVSVSVSVSLCLCLCARTQKLAHAFELEDMLCISEYTVGFSDETKANSLF